MLQRCVFRELVQTFILCLVSLLTLILIGRGLQMRELFLGLEIGPLDMVMLFCFMMPMFLIIVLPISCMVSVFLTFLRMSTDRELVALKAGGISIYQMLRAPAVFSFLCMCLALFVSLEGISWGMGSFRSTLMSIANTRARIVIQPGVFNQDIFGLTLFARKVDPVSGRLSQVVFEDSTQTKGSSITILAPEGEILTDEKRGELVFNLLNGRIYRVDGDSVSLMHFEEYAVRLNLSKVFSGIQLADIRPKEMSVDALMKAAREGLSARRGKAPSERFLNKVKVEIQKRWALPAACLVLGIFALPLACSFEGVKRQLGIVLALALFLAYYSLFSMGLNLGESGRVPPWVGLWVGNVIFAVAAVVGLQLVNRERVPSLAQWFHSCRNAVCGLGRRLNS